MAIIDEKEYGHGKFLARIPVENIPPSFQGFIEVGEQKLEVIMAFKQKVQSTHVYFIHCRKTNGDEAVVFSLGGEDQAHINLVKTAISELMLVTGENNVLGGGVVDKWFRYVKGSEDYQDADPSVSRKFIDFLKENSLFGPGVSKI